MRPHTDCKCTANCPVNRTQVTRDVNTSLGWCADQLSHQLTGLDIRVLAKQELFVMETIQWKLPYGDVYQNYINELYNIAQTHLAATAPRRAPPRVLMHYDAFWEGAESGNSGTGAGGHKAQAKSASAPSTPNTVIGTVRAQTPPPALAPLSPWSTR